MGWRRVLLRLGARDAVGARAASGPASRRGSSPGRARSARTAASRSRSVWEDEPEVEQALSDAKIRYEAIHHYELDDGRDRLEPECHEQP